MNKEAGFGIQARVEQPVNPEVVWGSQYKLSEIIGHGSGQGFELSGLSLPRDWELGITKLKSINFDVISNSCREMCLPWNYDLNLICFDRNNVLKEVIITDNKTNSNSRLILSDSFIEKEKGVYVGENLKTIEPTIILQQIGCMFLQAGWSENGYPCVSGNRHTGFGPGFGQNCLQIPEKYY